jgi:hypothetical protein
MERGWMLAGESRDPDTIEEVYEPLASSVTRGTRLN